MVGGNKQPQHSDCNKSRLRLWISLLRTSRAIETEIRERLRSQFNETLPRFDVMAALYRQPDGMMMSQLSRFLMVSNGNVTGIVDRLVKDHLVVRSQRDGDRRSWIISLTKSGTKSFTAMAAAHENWIAELLQGFDENEMEIVQSCLMKLDQGEKTR